MPAFTPLPPLDPTPCAPPPAAPPAADEPEKFVIAKQLTELFHQRGVPIHYRYARALVTQCPHTVHGRYVRFSDAWTWWTQTPAFRPFSVKKRKPASPRAFARSPRA